jgi:hypothetical protein
MPNEPVLVYSTVDGEPAMMHSVDASEACRLGDYTYMAPKETHDKDGVEVPEHAMARGRAMARFMGGGLDQMELKSPEEREDVRAMATEVEAKRMAPPVVVQVAPEVLHERQASRNPMPRSAHEAMAPKMPAKE